MEKIEEFIIGKKIAITQDFASDYNDQLLQNKFRNRVCLGVISQEGKSARYHLVDFTKNPGALYAGKMGSGKSYSMLFTLATWLASNGDQTIMFLVDIRKGMADYAALFDGTFYGMRQDDRPFKQVYPCLSSEDKVHKVIDLVMSEISAREKLFLAINASSIEEYENLVEDEKTYARLVNKFPGKKIPKKIPRILLAFEEFAEIPVILDFENNVKKPGTTAKKLASIGKVGRTFGCWLFIATQRATQSDIPVLIKTSMSNQMIHKVLPQEASYLKMDGAATISNETKGRCFCEEGEVQFPYFGVDKDGKENLASMLKHMVQPLVAECAYLTDKIINEYLSGRTSEDLYEAKTSEDLIESIDNLDTEVVLSLIHKRMGYRVNRRNYKTDEHGICHIMNHENKRIAVTFVDGKKISPSSIPLFMDGIREEELDGGIIYITQANITAKAMGDAHGNCVKIFTIEDLLRKARQLDEGSFESIVKSFNFFRARDKAKEDERQDEMDLNEESEKSGKKGKKGKTKYEDIEITPEERRMIETLKGAPMTTPMSDKKKAFEQAFMNQSNPFVLNTLNSFFDPDDYKHEDFSDELPDIKSTTGQMSLIDDE